MSDTKINATNASSPTPEKPKKDKDGGANAFWIVATVLLLFALLVSGFIIFSLLMVVGTMGGTIDMAGELNKKVVESHGDYQLRQYSQILVIKAKGVITSYASMMADNIISPDDIEKQLKQAAEDDNIKAVILQVNSPGGEITASDKIYQAILEFRTKTKKPIIAYFDTVSASGGYYISCGCDEIVAHPTCITGSIGVIFSFFQMQDLMENKLGIRHVVIKSGDHKDLGSFSRPMTDAEKQILQDMLNEMYLRFLDDVVLKARPELAKLPREEILKIADGRIYTAKQAKEKYLIDQICYWKDAITRIRELAKIGEDYQLVSYRQQKSLFQEIMETQTQSSTKSLSQEVGTVLDHYTRPQLYYMWVGN